MDRFIRAAEGAPDARRLYLDTARVGLACREGYSARFDDLRRRGHAAWPRSLRDRYRGFATGPASWT